MDTNRIAVVIAAIALVLSLYDLVWRQREARVRRKWEQDQERVHIASTRPNPIPAAAYWNRSVLEGERVPQRLVPTAMLQHKLENRGMSMPTDVYAVLFPAIVIDPTTQRRVDDGGYYWAGRFDESLAPGDSKAIALEQRNFPLSGDQELIPGHTLFARPQPNPSEFWGHYYFARLTITFRDATGRLLASIYDWESVIEKETNTMIDALKQKPSRVTGPIEVTQSLQSLIDRTARSRTPSRYQPQGSPISIDSPPSGGAHPVTLTSRLQSLLVSLTPWARRDTSTPH